MDIWLLFGLTLPFISFILSILEELMQDREENEAKVINFEQRFTKQNFNKTWTAERQDLRKETASTITSERWIETPKRVSKQRVVQIFARIVLPLITTAFVLFYISAAAYIFKNPELKYK